MKIFLREKRLKRISLPYSDHSQSSSVRDMSGEVSTVAGPSSGPVIDLTERTDALVRGLTFLLEHHRAPSRVTSQLKIQLHDYLDTSGTESVWLKRSKYVLTYPFAKFLRNELPPCPDVAFRPSGPLRRWMKSRMNAFCRRNVHLWYSWLQAKRCALSVSDSMVAEAYEKHFKQLTQDDPCSGDPLDPDGGAFQLERIFENPTFRSVLSSVRDVLTRNYVNEKNFTDRTASNSACFESSRSSGGQYNGLCQVINAEVGFDVKTGQRPNWIGGDELRRMSYRRTLRGNSIRFDAIEEYERCGRYWWKMLVGIADSRFTEVPANLNATIQAVLEPLKIRIISKGPSFEYYQMKPLQVAMHSALREMPCFRLLGRPICPTDLIDCVIPDEVDDLGRVHEMNWISVDYSAATDGLSSEYGMRILDWILRDIPNEDRIRAGKVLGPHNLHYPQLDKGKWSKEGKLYGCQRNGQLMGGILSFPILCLANLGVYLRVLQNTNGRTSEDDLKRVLINGDDMLYVGRKDQWDSHKAIGKRVGLEMSVGKAYMHRSYANANSTCFVYDLSKDTKHPFQINFLNVGLVFGQHKVQERSAGTAESHHTSSGCVPNIPAILSGCLPGRQSEVLRWICINRRSEIREDTKAIVVQGRHKYFVSRNLFLPICFGGMGIDAPLDWQFTIKKIDRRIAASLASDSPTSEYPLEGYPVEKVVDPIPSWIAKKAEPQLPEFRLCQGRKRVIPRVPQVPWWPSRGVSQ